LKGYSRHIELTILIFAAESLRHVLDEKVRCAQP